MQSKTSVYVIMPVVIEGVGKSYFASVLREKVEKEGFKFSHVENKEIRNECTKMFPEGHLRVKRERTTRNTFIEELVDLIEASQSSGYKAHFIYLDKKHPPNAWKVFGDIKKAKNSMCVKIVALIPEGNLSFRDNNGGSYPFSAHLILNSLDRIRRRASREVFSGKERESARLFLTILNQFKNLDFKTLKQSGFNKVFPLPFTREEDPINIPKDLENALKDVLSSDLYSKKTNDTVEELIYLLNSYDLNFKTTEKRVWENSIDKFFQTEIFPEVFPGYKAPVPLKNDFPLKEIKENPQKPLSKDSRNSKEIPEVKYASHYLPPKDPNEFNPRSVPAFLGIFTLESEFSKLKDLVIKTAQKIVDSEIIQHELFIKEYFKDLLMEKPKLSTFIESPHITSLKINGDKTKTMSDLYKKFKPDYQMEIEITSLVIVPNKFIIALCSVDQSVVKIEQKHPQMLLVKGSEWLPGKSVDFIERLHEDGYLNGAKDEITKIVADYLGENTTVYIVKNKSNLILAESRARRVPDEF